MPSRPRPGDRVGGQRQRPDRLDRPGREAAGERPPRAWPRQPAVGVGRVAAPERVVEQAEQRDAEHVDDPAAQLGVEQVEVGAVVEHRERGEREQRAGDQRRPGRERDLAPGVVRRAPGPTRSMSASHGPSATAATAAESDQAAEHQLRGAARRRSAVADGREQVGQQAVGGLLDPEAALGAVERVDQRDPAGESGRRCRRSARPRSVEELDRGRVGVGALGADRLGARAQPRDQPVLDRVACRLLPGVEVRRALADDDDAVDPVRAAAVAAEAACARSSSKPRAAARPAPGPRARPRS